MYEELIEHIKIDKAEINKNVVSKVIETINTTVNEVIATSESRKEGVKINEIRERVREVVNKEVESFNISEEAVKETNDKFIPIPKLQIISKGEEMINFIDFDLDKLNPVTEIVKQLKSKASIDYDANSRLLRKLAEQFVSFYTYKYGLDGAKNIVGLNKIGIGEDIYRQIEKLYIYETVTNSITDYCFTGINKSVFSSTKFDSLPELYFARVLERDEDVVKWLRPNINEFQVRK